MGEQNARTVRLFAWISSGDFVADWAVRLDTLSAVMLIVVNTVSFLVHYYSIGYMHEDEGGRDSSPISRSSPLRCSRW